MRPFLALGVAFMLVVPQAPLLAQPAPTGGFVHRALARDAERLALAPQPSTPMPASPAGVLELRWEELSPLVLGHRVTIFLADDTRVHGDVAAVRDDAIVLADARASGPGALRPGGAYPRGEVTRISVQREGRSGGRTLGTIVGVLTGVVLGGWVSAESADSAGVGVPLFLGIASGITAVGYYTGRRLDQRTTMIRIVS